MQRMDKQFKGAKETLFWRFSVLLNTFVPDFTNVGLIRRCKKDIIR